MGRLIGWGASKGPPGPPRSEAPRRSRDAPRCPPRSEAPRRSRDAPRCPPRSEAPRRSRDAPRPRYDTRLGGGPAAVDGEDGARDVAGGVGGEVEAGLRDVVGMAGAADGDAVLEHPLAE